MDHACPGGRRDPGELVRKERIHLDAGDELLRRGALLDDANGVHDGLRADRGHRVDDVAEPADVDPEERALSRRMGRCVLAQRDPDLMPVAPALHELVAEHAIAPHDQDPHALPLPSRMAGMAGVLITLRTATGTG